MSLVILQVTIKMCKLATQSIMQTTSNSELCAFLCVMNRRLTITCVPKLNIYNNFLIQPFQSNKSKKCNRM